MYFAQTKALFNEAELNDVIAERFPTVRARYKNIRWYLDTLRLNFEETIKIVNNIPKLYHLNKE